MYSRNFLIFGLALVILCSGVPTLGYEINTTYTNSDSQDVNFKVYEGSFLFVEALWTACIHCKNEYPTIKQIYDSYGSKLKMLSLAIWPDRDNLDSIKQWSTDYPSPWDVGVDTLGTFAKDHNVTATPTMLLFDKQGNQIYNWGAGEKNYTELASVIDQYVNMSVSSNTGSSLPFANYITVIISMSVLVVFIKQCKYHINNSKV